MSDEGSAAALLPNIAAGRGRAAIEPSRSCARNIESLKLRRRRSCRRQGCGAGSFSNSRYRSGRLDQMWKSRLPGVDGALSVVPLIAANGLSLSAACSNRFQRSRPIPALHDRAPCPNSFPTSRTFRLVPELVPDDPEPAAGHPFSCGGSSYMRGCHRMVYKAGGVDGDGGLLIQKSPSRA